MKKHNVNKSFIKILYLKIKHGIFAKIHFGNIKIKNVSKMFPKCFIANTVISVDTKD